MQELLLIISWILFAFLIILAIAGFFHIRNAIKNNIQISNARVSQWAFSVILCLLFSLANLEKVVVIYMVPLFYILSFTYFGSFIAVVTLSLLNKYSNDERDLISRIENENNKKEIIKRLCFEFADNIQNIVLPETNLNQNKFNEKEGLIFSIFVIFALYVLTIIKQEAHRQAIDKFGNAMRLFVDQRIRETNSGEGIDRKMGSLEEEYDSSRRVRFDQYYLVLADGVHLETISRLMGIFAENFFMEALNEDDKKLFIENMAMMLSHYMERLTSEIKW